MRRPRLKAPASHPVDYDHCVSRVVNRDFVLGGSELKQRFSQLSNGRHARRETLWEDRYRSVLVEGSGLALRATAAYIDLTRCGPESATIRRTIAGADTPKQSPAAKTPAPR